MVRLRWDGRGTFTDHARSFRAAPGTHDVTEEQAEEYLDHDLFGDDWERLEDGADSEGTASEDGADDGRDPDEGDTEDSEDSAGEDDQDGTVGDDDQDGAETETDADTEAEDDPADDDGEFDAEAFIDEDWRKVKPPIDAGDVDEHLEAIRKAEKARENGPRDSVIGAIDKRTE